MADPIPKICALGRIAWLDRARGIALLAMIVYHAIWDGLMFGLIPWSVGLNETMVLSAKIIAGSFLLISGISLALAAHVSPKPLTSAGVFWKRVAIIAAAAAFLTGEEAGWITAQVLCVDGGIT